MFAGSTSQIPLAEVCRLLSASNQTGVLNLTIPQNDQNPLGIYFHLGQIIEAQCGAATGLDGLSDLCNYHDLNFVFEVGAAAPSQTLAVYPTAKLIERIRQQVKDNEMLKSSLPEPNDILIYKSDTDMTGLEASADQLGLLLLCNGSRTLLDLAKQVNQNPTDLARVIARFRLAGIIEVKKGAAPAANNGTAYLPDAPGVTGSSGGTPRYWRGKLVE
ncbi:MAG: DUF4388 domain-containing protein [Verrucomicrobiales bacterium]|jgi:hypothetical protein|nr:DUF4388 domain-containing protein [Verrucomicrobiales bacterium]